MVFGHNGLPSGPGNACISMELTSICQKVERANLVSRGRTLREIPGEKTSRSGNCRGRKSELDNREANGREVAIHKQL